jgi:hypothetical protein
MFKENHDPVLFDSPALENANVTVLHCREVLEKNGMTTEATRLQGLEVTDRVMAKVGLDILNRMRVKAEAVYAVEAAVSSLEAAIRS